MLSIGDCVGMCGLSEDELQVLAEHERLPMIVAAELAAELLKTPKGIWLVQSCMLEALQASIARRDVEREAHLRGVIVAFSSSHPAPPVS